jgi:diamine N-acetyltransferase
MSNNVYIRPLQVEDALTSYQWRNDPKIWRFTGSRPDRYITPEMETAWLISVLKRENEKRFAICLCENDQYIGNVFFTDIKNNECQGHIFIGEVKNWGKGRAFEVGWLALSYMFTNVQLELIYMEMHKNNPGMGGIKRMGWLAAGELENGFVKYVFTRKMFEQRQAIVQARFKHEGH